MSNANSRAPSFTSPATAALLTFTLLVTDAQGLPAATPDSVFVTVPTVQLHTATDGTGSGSLSLQPADGSYGLGALVTLTATPTFGSVFTGWQGDCSEMVTCTLTMTANKAITATFRLLNTVVKISLARQESKPIAPGDIVTWVVTISNTGEITTTVEQISATLSSTWQGAAQLPTPTSLAAACAAPIVLPVAAVHQCSIAQQVNGSNGETVRLQVTAVGSSVSGTAVSDSGSTTMVLESPIAEDETREPVLDKRLFLPLVAR